MAAVMARCDDVGRTEPVVLVAVLEGRLQRREADRHRHNAGPVALPQQAELHRRRVKRHPEQAEHDRTRHQVDVEDVLPAEILGQVAADRRPDRRREGCGQREQGQADWLLGLGQQRDDDGERHRDQHTAREALDGAKDDHLLQVLGVGTGDREHQEQHGVYDQIAAQREHLREPAGQRDHDDLGDQVGGRDPAAVIDPGADRALDIGQRGVDDLDVEHRHERAKRGADDGHPGLPPG